MMQPLGEVISIPKQFNSKERQDCVDIVVLITAHGWLYMVVMVTRGNHGNHTIPDPPYSCRDHHHGALNHMALGQELRRRSKLYSHTAKRKLLRWLDRRGN
eukprot:sb/3478517/